EFWAEGDLGDIENRCASSSAHIYGKNKVSAESFTAGGGAYARYPALLKPRGDRFFTEGINNTLLHVFISQPDDRMPGINAWFGTEFNRHNTWFDQLDVFTTYLKRCNFMLRQGRYVADVAYFIGEDAPKMTGVRDPELPKGYSYDFINAEVIEKRLFIKDRRWTLPNGLSYKVLVLPKLKTMRPELLRRLDELVQQGGVLLGPPPERSPSLEDYGEADEEVRTLAGLLWGDMDGKENNWRVVGKGIVAYGMDLQALLNKRGVGPDCRISGSDSVLFLHRTTGAEDIYFISNQSGRRVVVDAAFRVRGKAPELWDPLLGKVRKLAAYTQEGEVTRVPLQLERYGSCFVVFRAGAGGDMAETTKGAGGDVTANFPAPTVVVEVRGPWTVRFDKASRGPVTPVVFDALTDWAMCRDTAIKYYSGKAVYKNTFRLAETVAPLYLDLGMVRVMAKVKVNGVYVGGVWTSPYVVDISAAVKKGVNVVEVEVVNTWVNRLIGDSRLPEGERRTWMNVNPYNPGSALAPSGLLGPVRVVRAL
ncbi:MAG TPA: glycosyl hydrolase, partial [Puia sp.]|nr:glycosyl hydrolase [Puia sp.]